MSDFSDLAQHHFGFLVQQHGFHIETVGERLLTYENGSLFFQVGLGRRGEVGLTLDKYPPSEYFPFAFYLKVFFPDQAARLEERPTMSKLEMDVVLGELAGLLKEFGDPLFKKGDEVVKELAARALQALQ